MKILTSPDFAHEYQLVALLEGSHHARHVAPGLVVQDQLMRRHCENRTHLTSTL